VLKEDEFARSRQSSRHSEKLKMCNAAPFGGKEESLASNLREALLQPQHDRPRGRFSSVSKMNRSTAKPVFNMIPLLLVQIPNP
jgi:hypothetical protein